MVTKTALEVPADPKWRHVVSATVLSAVRAASTDPEAQLDLGHLGDLSLLIDRALDTIQDLAGVVKLTVDVQAGQASSLITVVGQGEEIEPPVWHEGEPASSWTDQLTGSAFEWTPAAVTCSFRVPSTQKG